MSDVPMPLKAHYDISDEHDFRRASTATDDQIENLNLFRDLVATWNGRMNLVGPSALNQFWSRHAWDSAQLLRHAPDAKVWADLGAGAGFPGIVLAILLKGSAGAHVHLIESMAKRCRFLEEAVTRLGLQATVHHWRAEEGRLAVDAVTARACAPLVRLLVYAKPYLKEGARGLFLKGKDVDQEVAEARRSWTFSYALSPSLSHADGRILTIDGAPCER